MNEYIKYSYLVSCLIINGSGRAVAVGLAGGGRGCGWARGGGDSGRGVQLQVFL